MPKTGPSFHSYTETLDGHRYVMTDNPVYVGDTDSELSAPTTRPPMPRRPPPRLPPGVRSQIQMAPRPPADRSTGKTTAAETDAVRQPLEKSLMQELSARLGVIRS